MARCEVVSNDGTLATGQQDGDGGSSGVRPGFEVSEVASNRENSDRFCTVPKFHFVVEIQPSLKFDERYENLTKSVQSCLTRLSLTARRR